MERAEGRTAGTRAGIFVVFFASGFVALVYEVLWLRELRLVFGAGAPAAATTLAVFFAGMAAGSAIFGRWSGRLTRPIRGYAALELATGAAALLSLLLPSAHAWIYPSVSETLGSLALARVLLAVLLLFPAAFFLGGTLPVLGEALVGRPSELATTAGRLYATNTSGAAIGALAAGFLLPPWLGHRGSYLLAIALNVALAGAAFALDRTRMPRSVAFDSTTGDSPLDPWVGLYAFACGFVILALEVLWTRMFALVLNSSVYAFATILVVFLAALAVGAVLAVRLARELSAELQLFALLLGAGLTTGASPFVLHGATGQLGSIPIEWGFVPYVGLTFGTVLLVVLPPAALAGAILPSLLRFCERDGVRPGGAIGRAVAWNTLGGVAGSLCAGFLLLPTVGLWRSTSILAVAFLGLATFAVGASTPGARHLRPAALVAAVLLGTFLDPTRLALVRVAPGEVVEHVWETPQGVVAATRDDAGRRIRLDNTYVLGGTEGRAEEALQAELPLALHPSPTRVFFLGLGSGITAATALDDDRVEHVTVTELVPEVIDASRRFFETDAGPLFRDPRAIVVPRDGRLVLATSSDRWDVIVSDLFVPWHDGTASLYSREHYEATRRRLATDGLFVQWLPLFQLTRSDFDVIAATMSATFGPLDLWIADLRNGAPIAALVAGPTRSPDPVSGPARRIGRIAADDPILADAPIHTDDRPLLEYTTPLSQAAVRSGTASWLVGPELHRLETQIRRR